MKRVLLLVGAELAAFVLLGSIPFWVANSYFLALLTLLAIYGILLIGLDVSVGYLGQVNLGQAAFLGLGAYSAALSVSHLGLGFLAALTVALITGLVFGAFLAYPALQLQGPQFALATLSFSALTATTLNELEGLTGGAQGLSVVRPALFGLTLDAKGFYWVCLLLLAVTWTGMKNLLASHWGRSFEALRDSPIATDAMGVDTRRFKIMAFAFGSALGSFAGGLYAFNFRFLQPGSFVYELMVILLLGVVLGGRKSLWGGLVGASLIVLLPNLLSNRSFFRFFAALGLLFAVAAAIRKSQVKKQLDFQTVAPVVSLGILVIGGFLVRETEDWRRAIFALILFSVVVGLPEGLMGFAARFLSGLLKVPPPPLPEATEVLKESLPRTGKGVILELVDLKRHFGGIRAVDGISMRIEEGTVHGLIGPNGSGKSTLVNLVSGVYTPSSGKILFNQKPLPEGSLVRVARSGIARTFQTPQLYQELSAMENVMVALRDRYKIPLLLILIGLGKREEQKARADALFFLTLVRLQDQARTRARDLTYGSQRFLEIARALARRPDILILDEPAAGLARPDVLQLIDLIKRIRQMGITVILIEHHMDVVTELCETVTVLDGGKVIAQGSPDDVKRNPKVIEAYLGASGRAGSYRSERSTSTPPILVVENLHAGYNSSEVLKGASFKVSPGSVVALIGANGAGKTTALRTISGTLRFSKGRILFDRKELKDLGASEIARLGLAHSPEGRRIFAPLTVEDNLLLGAYGRLPKFSGFKRNAASDLEKIYVLFPKLKERFRQTAGTLSGGEQQMLAIGRALMANPKLILLDEPSMGLAPVIVQEVFEIIYRLKDAGMTILLVEQFAERALAVADYGYVMEQGKIALEGTPAELARNPRILSAYLG